MPDRLKPQFVHDCDMCVFLGRHDDPVCDLYYCGQGGNNPTVAARYGDTGSNYQSGLGAALSGSVPELKEAYARAVRKGLIKPKTARILAVKPAGDHAGVAYVAIWQGVPVQDFESAVRQVVDGLDRGDQAGEDFDLADLAKIVERDSAAAAALAARGVFGLTVHTVFPDDLVVVKEPLSLRSPPEAAAIALAAEAEFRRSHNLNPEKTDAARRLDAAEKAAAIAVEARAISLATARDAVAWFFYPDKAWGGYARFFEPPVSSEVGERLAYRVRRAIQGDTRAAEAARTILSSRHAKLIPPGSAVMCVPTPDAVTAVGLLDALIAAGDSPPAG